MSSSEFNSRVWKLQRLYVTGKGNALAEEISDISENDATFQIVMANARPGTHSIHFLRVALERSAMAKRDLMRMNASQKHPHRARDPEPYPDRPPGMPSHVIPTRPLAS
ncbi:hypothetical protein CERSUDRAFT_95477 [Gelatoporia subvermispora B]|uniref:Uncharacterized protein n=1 Tax=Ceriporiopsis subvermispora (strain B) TaxID=914234 RepID=M2RFI5_CERS8|nr:hypothetical protein CERSUDRAFT_95477 [Gelatoporia subvermispora B]